VERDSLANFFPALLLLTLLAAALEGGAAAVLNEAAFATAALSTAAFAIGVAVAWRQSRAGRPVRARAALAISLTLFGAVGSLMIPGVAQATALLPVVAVILVLPHVPRKAFTLVGAAAVGSAAMILVFDQLADREPAIAGLAGTIFRDAIHIGVLILVLAGLSDFAISARNSLKATRDLTERQLGVTTSRLSLVAALRVLHAEPTPEATAAGIARALIDLPLVDVAAVLEATEEGLVVLAASGGGQVQIESGEILARSRAQYLLDQSQHGAWGELWADRPMQGFDDERATRLGMQGQVFAPILSGDEVVGLIGIGTIDRDQAIHLVADLPSVGEAASVAGAILAPALVARRKLSFTRGRIAEIISTGAFHPVFQPIVDLQTGLTVGFEALTRFAAGDAPDRLFADAARVGLGPELEAATLAAAVGDAVRLPQNDWLSLNVSPVFLGECATLAAILRFRTRSIVLEITEHEIINDYAPLHAAMRTFGPDVRLAVDDAGAGVANFQHLVDLRPDIVKIDASLIRGVNADVSRQALIVGFLHFAEASGALVLAEGIETQAEQDTVQRLGVTLGQGYHLGYPAPVATWANATAAVPRPPVLAQVIPIRRSVARPAD
jgi:EAL domain-containing protein (putative c-di-GMP-specific phosphodiesterase class I)